MRWARLVTGPVLALLLAVGGCAAAPTSVTPSPAVVSPTPLPSTVNVPADGILLSDLGFENAPATVSLPRTSIFVTAVDQPNVVTVVLRSPDPDVVEAYLRTNLPPAGFEVTASDPATATFAFAGGGWSGSFTANGNESALRLSRS